MLCAQATLSKKTFVKSFDFFYFWSAKFIKISSNTESNCVSFETIHAQLLQCTNTKDMYNKFEILVEQNFGEKTIVQFFKNTNSSRRIRVSIMVENYNNNQR